MKKHYLILAAICILTVALLLLEGRLSTQYDPQAQFSTEADSLAARVEVNFDYTPQPVLGSNQIAAWIEDESGTLVKTLAVTKYTATGGWRLRKTSLPLWVQAAEPATMTTQQVDAVSAATPRQAGTYTLSWDLTDDCGQPVLDGTYTCYVEATLYFTDHVLFFGRIQTQDGQGSVALTPSFRDETSPYAGMVRNVSAVYYAGEGSYQ